MSVPTHFGRYRVLRPLASGEMGVVYLAEDPLIGRRVAIKGVRYIPDAEDEDIRRLQARFDQEIQAAGTFSHPNIVTLFDVGRQDGRAFIAMEYVEGRNLRAEMQAHGRMSVDRAIELSAPVSRALSYAHDRKIIHRDIKPTNILVSSEGIPKITDFGVARLYGSTLTHTGKIFGTPAYMSPEQAIGGELTGASDQFAVAAVAYELLTGERPFKGTSPTAVIYEVIEHHPEPPHDLIPLVPAAVGRVVMRGLEKNPEDRYESCEAFAEALEMAAEWSNAHPEQAYLEDPGPPHDTGVTATREDAVPGAALGRQLSDVLHVAAAVRVPERARTLIAGVRAGSRSFTAMVAGVVGLALLLTVVTMVATAGAPSTQPVDDAGNDPGVLVAAEPRRATPTRGAEAPTNTPVATQATTVNTEEPRRGVPRREEPRREEPVAGAESRTFVISTRPPGARIALNGDRLAGAAPLQIQVDQDQRNTLRLELEGFEPITWSFAVEDLSPAHLESGELHFPLAALAVEPSVEEQLSTPATSLPGELLAPTPSPPSATERAGIAAVAESGGPPPPPTSVRRLRAPAQTPAPEKLRHVDPEIPDGTRVDGVVIVEIEVSARGNVVQAKVLRGLTPLADQAALAAVVQWKYRPTDVSGAPVHVLMTVTVPIARSGG